MPIVQYDDVTLTLIPPNPPAVAAYVDGRFANFAQAQQMFPFAHIMSIAVSSSSDARCLDVEPGDATNATAPGWLKRQLARGGLKPVVYTSASNIGALETALAGAGIARDRYLIWSAHYTFHPHICGPDTCGFPQADGTQWTDKALGRSLDESLLSDEFFGAPKPPPAPKPDTGAAHAAVTCHLGRKTGVWEVHGTAGPAHFGGADKWEEATIGVNLKTGKWRIRRKAGKLKVAADGVVRFVPDKEGA